MPLGRNTEPYNNIMNNTNGDKKMDMIWSEHDSGKVLIGKYLGGGKASTKIASFDYDGTMILTKSGKTFPQDTGDWKLFTPRFGDYLGRLEENSYRIVIISNQKGVSTGKMNANDLKKRFGDTLTKIGVPCLVLIATHDDIYRKPRIGLWQYFVDIEQPGMTIDSSTSFYVGDAAGREKSSTHSRKDHSLVDLLFAINCGLSFITPEEFVKQLTNGARSLDNSVDMASKLLAAYSSSKSIFQPAKVIDSNNNANGEHAVLLNANTGEKVIDIASVLPATLHCILFVGLAGSGKSTFYANYLAARDYVRVNMDILKSSAKCLSVANQALASSKNVVIDNTNVDRASRANWLNLCRKMKAQPIIFYFKLPLEHIFHNHRYRKLHDPNNSVNEIIIYGQNKKLEPPTSDEGVVYQVNFVAKFVDAQHESLYRMFLNEK